MKRLFICLGIMTIIFLTGCKDNMMTNQEYVTQYDKIIYDLEKFISDDVYFINYKFFDQVGFPYNFSVHPYKQSLDELLKVIDDAMYKLNEIGPMIEDYKIQQYQSKIEFALKDIRSKVFNYTGIKALQTSFPNKTTLYHETYKLMLLVQGSLMDLKDNMNKLDNHVESYRDYNNSDIDLNELKALKTKNRLRILYSYLYVSSYIASYDDYTGLHLDPRNPNVMSYNDGLFTVYELSLEILKPIRSFANDYFEYKDIFDKIDQQKAVDVQDIDKDIFQFAGLLNDTIKSIEGYYGIRCQFDDDFYTGDKFKEYQKPFKQEKIGTGFFAKLNLLYVFDEERDDYDFKSMKEYYYQVKFITELNELNDLMFPPDQFIKIESTFDE